MVNEEKKHNDILFGYFTGPSYGAGGIDDGGFSVSVYNDGKVIYKTYIFCRIVKTETEYKIPEDATAAIRSLMEDHQTDIDSFDKNIDNGSCDGSGNFFTFNGKEIITWNIDYNDEDKLKKNNPGYYKAYLSVIRQENQILSIFDKAAKILEKDEISLSLSAVSFGKNIPIKTNKKTESNITPFYS